MKRIAGLILCILLFASAGLAIRTWGITAVRISGTSMNNTLMNGDVVLVTRFDYLNGRLPDRMDVVQCRFDMRADTYVKRVIGLPGESIAYENSSLKVDGKTTSEPYVTGKTEDFHTKLDGDRFFLMGDNRPESYDSRAAEMGPVSEDALIGKVRWILWPIDRFGPVD